MSPSRLSATSKLLLDEHLKKYDSIISVEESQETMARAREAHLSWKWETKLLMRYTIPLILTYELQYFYNFIIILVASSLGTTELAAISIGISTINITGFAVFEGLATCLDTLCAQAYGAGNLKLVGLHVQRMVLFLLVVFVGIAGLYAYSPIILAWIVPQEELALLAGHFLRISIIGLPGYAVFEACKRFAQAQGNFRGGLVVLIACAPVNIFLNWLFVYRFQYGITGAALAAALTNNLRPVLFYFYILYSSPSCLECWPDISMSVFQNWAPMVKLSIPSAVLTLGEWMVFEILTFSTSYLSTEHVSAQTFLSTTCVLIWHIPFSASVAASTRIGRLIGAGDLEGTKLCAKLYVVIFAVIGVLDSCMVLSIVNETIAPLIISDPAVLSLITPLAGIVAVFEFFDCAACCTHGIMKGLGWQQIAGWTTFIVNYVYALPLALVLELGLRGFPKMELRGLWTSQMSGLALLTIAETIVMLCMRWDRAVDEAKRREKMDGIDMVAENDV